MIRFRTLCQIRCRAVIRCLIRTAYPTVCPIASQIVARSLSAIRCLVDSRIASLIHKVFQTVYPTVTLSRTHLASQEGRQKDGAREFLADKVYRIVLEEAFLTDFRNPFRMVFPTQRHIVSLTDSLVRKVSATPSVEPKHWRKASVQEQDARPTKVSLVRSLMGKGSAQEQARPIVVEQARQQARAMLLATHKVFPLHNRTRWQQDKDSTSPLVRRLVLAAHIKSLMSKKATSLNCLTKAMCVGILPLVWARSMSMPTSLVTHQKQRKELHSPLLHHGAATTKLQQFSASRLIRSRKTT